MKTFEIYLSIEGKLYGPFTMRFEEAPKLLVLKSGQFFVIRKIDGIAAVYDMAEVEPLNWIMERVIENGR